jgi:putative ABC transport system permease protein
MSLARRNLVQDKTRFMLSVIGVALAVMLILILSGFLNGMYRQISAYLDHTSGSIVVAQDGVRNLLGATSLLPPDVEGSVKTRGAAQVVPILSQFVILDLHDKKVPAYLVGYEPRRRAVAWRLTGTAQYQRGLRSRWRNGIPRSATRSKPDRDFAVVGLSDGTASWMTSFVFVRKTALEVLLRAPGATSFLLVTPSVRVGDDELRKRLSDLSSIEVTPKSTVMANDLSLYGGVFSGPIRLMVAIAFLVGTLVVGLVIYTATIERQREYGVLKAIGARNGLLYRTVTIQALIASGVGALIGVGLAFGLAQLIMMSQPQFLIVFESSAVIQSLLTGLAMALFAAWFPARVIARLAPAEVFRK